jgi:hypothetical protein
MIQGETAVNPDVLLRLPTIDADRAAKESLLVVLSEAKDLMASQRAYRSQSP